MKFSIVSFLLSLLLLSSLSFAQSLVPGNLDPGAGPVSLTADEVTYYRGEERYIVKGRVVVTTSRFTLTCDELEVWNKTGEMEARGNVRVIGPEGSLRADSLRMNSRANEGVVVNATLYLAGPHYTISGSKLEKVGQGNYLIAGATFTSCKCKEGEKPDWSIKAGDINAEQEGYARAKGATLRIKDTPIFYVPVGYFPIKQKRQTGFLIPRVAYSTRDEFEFVLPFYWAPSRWFDATIEEDYIQRRGLKQNIEARWVRSLENKGKLQFYYLDDRDVRRGRFAGVLTGGELLPYRIRINQEIRYVSDNEYIRDFRADGLNQDSRSRWSESRMLATMPFESMEPYIFASNINDIAGDQVEVVFGFRDADGLVPQRYPRAGFRVIETNIPRTPLWVKFRAQADTFYRYGPIAEWNNPTVSHKQEWSERATFEPSLTMPMSRSGMYFNPELAFNETVWDVTDSSAVARHLAIARAEIGMQAWRVYSSRFKHRIEPRVRYAYIEDLSPEKRPHFDLTDDISDLNGLQLNLDQRLFVKSKDAFGDMRGKEVLRFEITQWARLDEGQFRVLRGEIEARPLQFLVVRLDTKYDLYEGDYKYASATAAFVDKRKDVFDVGYRFQGNDPQLMTMRMQVRVNSALALNYSHFLDVDTWKLQDVGGGFLLTPKSDCWVVEFNGFYHTDPKEFRYSLRFVLVGLGSVGN